ncbi:MAG: hypothetical protein A2149_09000 [Candidatus Schekmanbacteria bacterium RBG_16_38_11]|uniref:SD-repeat containing protein B domain-containing protein n=1 Tax=Candidatus Schekmanbacteria bacterium RBG_16_38_11 TaxID=1817880 RepID=A0A1F7RWM1_9BACT|nr:MAG: hypothetical protein A2149_09000 [Candidatus Schekmanbacteria bacterium RBG_16_38_11]
MSASGMVYSDLLNCNGKKNPAERGIQHVKLTLSPLSFVTYTASDGTYSFLHLSPGSYIITETEPDGYVNCTPTRRIVK